MQSCTLRLCIESSEGLRRLPLTFDENLMAMEAMSINAKVNCFFCVHIVSEKLDPDCRRQWEFDSAGDNIRKLDDLGIFIIKHARALNASEKNKIQSPRSEKQFQSSHKQQTVQSYKATAVHCPICSVLTQSFSAIDSRMSLTERRKFAYSSKLCFNCLGDGHKTRD